jgi:flagellar biogenesis protein FliO
MSTGVQTLNADETPRFSSVLFRTSGCLLDVIRQLQKQFAKVHIRQNKKRLRVCETVQLGEKRIVAVIQVDDKQFLVGGGSNSIALLAELEKPAELSTVLHSRIAEVNASA